jgi:L-alanine-DL-glutamate epimerase-like enolase superfamily enzyme
LDFGQKSGGYLSYMQLTGLKTFLVDLPFRLSFGHNLAARSSSTNVFVKVLLEDGVVEYAGLGESAPRIYVSGEEAQGCWRYLNDQLFPSLREALGQTSFRDLDALTMGIQQVWQKHDLDNTAHGASFCAMEIALFDAFCRSQGVAFHRLPHLIATGEASGALFESKNLTENVFGPDLLSSFVAYGGVVPFGKGAFLAGILNFYKAYNFATVKLKVGSNLEDNLNVVKLARQILSPEVKLRIDANCAWDLDSAQRHLAALRAYGVVSIEEPLAKGDLKNLAKLRTLIPEKIVVDESLTTLADARALIDSASCDAFNVRLSKLGGVLACMKFVDLATANGLEVHLGAQVGESGVLASAQRHFAAALGPAHSANVEGAMNLFLLKRDMTKQCLTVPFGAKARVSEAAGLGVSLSRAGKRYLGDFPDSFAAPAYALASPHKLTYAGGGQ